MARTRYHFDPSDPAPYFITATVVNWLPLFSNPDIARLFLDSLCFLTTSHRIALYAYVVMENHVHIIASAEDLVKEVMSLKSFTARKFIDYYLEQGNDFVLDQLATNKLHHKADRTYQFWQEGSHPQRIMDEKMMEQKMAYIHNNPVDRGYVDLPEHWRYSSARNYAGIASLVPVEWE